MGSSNFCIMQSATAVEKVFVKKLVDYILGLSDSITCDNDPDEEYDISTVGGDYTPAFNFKINDNNAFRLYRGNKLSTPTNAMVFVANTISVVPTNQKSITFVTNPGSNVRQYNESYTRGIVVSHIVNNNFIYLSFGSYDEGSARNSGNAAFLFCVSGNDNFVTSRGNVNPYSVTNCFDLSGLTLYDLAEELSAGEFVSRFAHAAPAGQIDYIKSSIYQNNSQKVFENKAVYDCSTVNVASTVSLKDGAYIAIGSHQLVKVS